MEMTPDILVITRTYDPERAPLLRRTMRSVTACKKECPQDWRMIHVVVDTSNGAVEDVVNDICRENVEHKVAYIKTTDDHVACLNSVISRFPSVRFIAILDDDDAWKAQFLAYHVGALMSNDACVGIVCNQLIQKETLVDGVIVPVEAQETRMANDITLLNLCDAPMWVHGQWVYRAGLHNQIGWYDEDFKLGEDYDFALRAATVGPIIKNDEVLLVRGIRAGNRGNMTKVNYHNLGSWNERIKDKYVRESVETGKGLGLIIAMQHAARKGG